MQQIGASIQMICVYTEIGLQTISACNFLIINSRLDGDKRGFSVVDFDFEKRFL